MFEVIIERHSADSVEIGSDTIAGCLPKGIPETKPDQRECFKQVTFAYSRLLIDLISTYTPTPEGCFIRIKWLGKQHDLMCDVDLEDDESPEEPVKAVCIACADIAIEVISDHWDKQGWSRPLLRPGQSWLT